MKIAYQGIPGSYSESCAKSNYPKCETISCKTFDECFEMANDDNNIKAVMYGQETGKKTVGTMNFEVSGYFYGGSESKRGFEDGGSSQTTQDDWFSFSGKTITFGTKVKIADEENGQETNYQIVGPYEANLEEGLISVASPIAKALIGKEEGMSVAVTTPRGTKNYEILSIEIPKS